jgi:hypothetical protein
VTSPIINEMNSRLILLQLVHVLVLAPSTAQLIANHVLKIRGLLIAPNYNIAFATAIKGSVPENCKA